jgi:lipoate---protein ligase
MARDADLLTQHRQGLIPSTFYLSIWEPACISIGHHQRVLPPACAQIPWVRRPTGGRAVWHGGDICYTFVTSGLVGNLNATYRQLSQILIQGLRHLGVELDYGQGTRAYWGKDACFAEASGADLCWQGQKVIGSAQLRQDGAILQQGSILIAPDYAMLSKLFPDTPLAIRGLSEILGYTPTPDEIQRVLALALNAITVNPQV